MKQHNKLQTLIYIVIMASFYLLPPQDIAAKTQASRPAEEMISNRQQHKNVSARTQTIGTAEKMVLGDQQKRPYASDIKPEALPQQKKPQQKNTKKPKAAVKQKSSAKPVQQQSKQQQNKQQSGPITTMLEDVRLDFSKCFYHPPTNSIACKMQLTNLAEDSDVTFFCYSGTQAKDSDGNVKECAHTWIGSNHSWNYAATKLQKGTPQQAMVRFTTGGRLNSLSMQLVFAINDVRKMVTLSNVPVQQK